MGAGAMPLPNPMPSRPIVFPPLDLTVDPSLIYPLLGGN
jgi:hypothetical protein